MLDTVSQLCHACFMETKNTRINWRVTTARRETLDQAAVGDGITLSAWLDRYVMPDMIRLAESQIEKRASSGAHG